MPGSQWQRERRAAVPTVERFSHAMVEKYLRNAGLNFLRDSDGDFLVQFAYDDDIGCKLSCYLLLEGAAKEIYCVRVIADKRISRNVWGQAVMLCNTWNKEKRWPKAFLYVKDAASDQYGQVMLEEQIDLEEGIHQELLNDFTFTVISGANTFWEWAKPQGL
jgi:hypothetical protein